MAVEVQKSFLECVVTEDAKDKLILGQERWGSSDTSQST